MSAQAVMTVTKGPAILPLQPLPTLPRQILVVPPGALGRGEIADV